MLKKKNNRGWHLWEYTLNQSLQDLRGKSENKIEQQGDFPGDAVVKNPPANAGDAGLIPDLGRSHMPWTS